MKSIFRVSLMASQGEDVAGGLHWGVELGWGIRGGGYVVQAQDGGEDDGDVGDGDGGPLAVLTHARSLFLLLPLQISLRPSPTLALSLARSHPLSLSLCFTHSHTHTHTNTEETEMQRQFCTQAVAAGEGASTTRWRVSVDTRASHRVTH